MTEGSSSNNGAGIEVALLEKRLEGLRDTQESVQGLSLWCQANKKYSTPIIDTWLRVLRRSPVEKRLTMFYLANDVVQHAKRKGDVTVVNQWAVAVQKATPHVRSPSSVSTAIVRIFKIWEERSIYSKDTVADLIALVNKHNPSAKERTLETKKKPEIYTAVDEKVKGFQASSLSSTIKQAYRLKSHLGVTFRTKQYFNMNMEQLIASIKDRQHGMSVIENMSELLDACRVSENKLVHEVDERRKIVEAAEVAIVYYENIRAEARIVNTAYKNFTERVVKTKYKVDEMLKAFAEMEGSPIASPDRLSPYDDVQVLLPPIAEFEARQAQASNLIEVVQSNSNSTSKKSNTPDVKNSFNESQFQNNTITEDSNRDMAMIQGMLASGTAYDLMSVSQWPNYAMQLQMMQQQVAQAYAYQSDQSNSNQQQQPSTGNTQAYSYPQQPDQTGLVQQQRSPDNSQSYRYPSDQQPNLSQQQSSENNTLAYQYQPDQSNLIQQPTENNQTYQYPTDKSNMVQQQQQPENTQTYQRYPSSDQSNLVQQQQQQSETTQTYQQRYLSDQSNLTQQQIPENTQAYQRYQPSPQKKLTPTHSHDYTHNEPQTIHQQRQESYRYPTDQSNLLPQQRPPENSQAYPQQRYTPNQSNLATSQQQQQHHHPSEDIGSIPLPPEGPVHLRNGPIRPLLQPMDEEDPYPPPLLSNHNNPRVHQTPLLQSPRMKSPMLRGGRGSFTSVSPGFRGGSGGLGDHSGGAGIVSPLSSRMKSPMMRGRGNGRGGRGSFGGASPAFRGGRGRGSPTTTRRGNYYIL